MNKPKTKPLRYSVYVLDLGGVPGTIRFTFVPKGPQQSRQPGEPLRPVPEYVLSVRGQGGDAAFEWTSPPPRAATTRELEQLARDRMAERAAWSELVAELVGNVEKWARELGWSTRRIEKKLEDSRIGNHKIPALLMQEETVRVLLDPIASSAPGSLGLVDLYLMPGYDDIASLYYRDGGWHVHYAHPGMTGVASPQGGDSRPLSRKTLGVLLGEMKKHAQ